MALLCVQAINAQEITEEEQKIIDETYAGSLNAYLGTQKKWYTEAVMMVRISAPSYKLF